MMPLSWETPFLTALENFCVGSDGTNPGFVPHYLGTVPANQLLALECGAPYGVEWFGALEFYFEAQYSMSFDQWESIYIGYANGTIMWPAIHNYAVMNPTPTFAMLVPDGVFAACPSDAQCSAYSDYVAQQSLQFSENNPGYLGLRAVDLLNYANGVLVRGDWINIANQNRNRAFYFLEPLGVSCPSGTIGCSTTQTVTGDLTQTLPFAMQHLGQGSAVPIIILFGYDDVCPWDSSFTVTITGGAYPSCSSMSYYQAYQQTELNTAAGLPWYTNSVSGTTSTTGNASIH
jgi:hypothetical protein